MGEEGAGGRNDGGGSEEGEGQKEINRPLQ